MQHRMLMMAGSLALASVGCSTPTAPVERLHVEVALDRTDVTVGEAVGVRVRVINPMAETVTLSGSASCLVSYGVVDAAGRLRGGSIVCVDMRAVRQLAPGDTLVESTRWLGQLTDLAANGSFAWAPPGRYSIRGEVNAEQGRRVSQPVAIQVRAVAWP